MRRDEAAVDSELALLPLIEEKLPLAGPLLQPGLYHHEPGNASSNQRRAARHPARRSHARRLRAGWWTKRSRPRPMACGVAPTLTCETSLIRPTSSATTGFAPRRKSAAARALKPWWTRIRAHFPAGFPMSQIALYMGWYDGNASGPFAQPKVEFMPGAFAYHLHSYSAATLRSTNQYWVGPLLAKGATISMGSVAEPYLSGTPDVAIFSARLIFLGFTFGQAAYAAQQTLSWQTTVVGDPLYRPFGKNPDQLYKELAARNSKLVEWSFLRLVNINLVAGKPLAELVALLEQLEETKRSAVLTEKLADLYTAQGKPSSVVSTYRQALQLDPSPQQRIPPPAHAGRKAARPGPHAGSLRGLPRAACRSSRITRINWPFAGSSWPWPKSWTRRPMPRNTRLRSIAWPRPRRNPEPATGLAPLRRPR